MEKVRPILSKFWKLFPGIKGKLGFIIILLFIIVAVFAPYIAPYKKNYIGFDSWLAPSMKHWMGTDSYGQDILSQMIFGTQTSLLVGILAGFITTVIGVLVGVIAGYKGGWVGEGLMRIVDLFSWMNPQVNLPLLLKKTKYF